MPGAHRLRDACLAFLFILVAVTTHAQSNEPRGYVAFKGGLNTERAEDNLNGSSPAAGATIGVSFAPHWVAELELWVPAFIKYGSPESGTRHRDILVNGAFIRSVDAGRVRSFALFGLGVGRTQQRFTNCTALRPLFGTGDIVRALVSCSEPDVITRHEERFDSMSVFLLVGGGAEIPVTRRIRLVPEVRMNLWITSVIARPSLGVKIAF